MDFVHLHLHTEYSLLDGAIRIKTLPKAIKEMGMTSCAITDHGSMFGVIDFYNACKKEGIKPILGCEVYVAARGRHDKEVNLDKDSYHMILLAKDETGFKNLIKLVSIGYVEGFYYKPRIDIEILKEHSDGIIALSACLAGEIPRCIMQHETAKAREKAVFFDELFGRGNFYLELQENKIHEQNIVNAALINISNTTGIPLVATNDCHYLKSTDAKAHEILLCMQTGKRMSDPDRMRMMSEEFYVKSPQEMSDNFKNIKSAIENTVKIADMCNLELDFTQTHLPDFDIPEGYASHDEYLRFLAFNGLAKRLAISSCADTKVYEERLSHELNVISSMKFTDYFLIVWDFIDYARKNGIMVGPGRGSGAGSLAAYSLAITDIDPLRYDLIFERFLNSDRVSMPDFDIDFCYERRSEVIDYVTNKYGKDRVAQVITFGTLAAKACVRDVARALDMPYSEADKLAKMIPFATDMTLEKAMKNSSDLKFEYDNNPSAKEVLDTALLFEGMPRHSSTHAAGVIISGRPLTDIAPLSRNDESIVVQYAKGNIELVGLLKFDFLGLRTLTVMRDTAEMVLDNYGVTINFDELSMDEPQIYKMISDGRTEGVFQLESPGMTSFMTDLKPENIEDIIAGISLFRPGPMEQIPKYVASKHDRSKITYKHPLLEPILDLTYGCIVYQEQVMRIVRDLAGFSMGQSDNVRRAMSKKKPEELAKFRTLFVDGGIDEKGRTVDGAINRGVPREIAESIYEEVMAFGGYAFNKSHAAAYAVIGYYTGWLKYHYPTEFMAAMLNSFMGNLDQAARYINTCKKMGIKVLPPDINFSSNKFKTEDGKIRFALSAVKNVGDAAICNLIKERDKNGKFESFMSFLERMSDYDLNKKMIESLIKASAFDSFNEKRSNLMYQYEPYLNQLARIKKSKMDGQLSLFDSGSGNQVPSAEIFDDNNLPEYEKSELLAMEKEVLGLYVTGHPLNEFMDIIDGRTNCDSTAFNTPPADEESDAVQERKVCDNQRVTMAGMCIAKKDKTTKNNEMMCFLTIEDLEGQFECIVFAKTYKQYASILGIGKVLFVRGRISVREEERPTLIAEGFSLITGDGNDLKNFPVLYDRKCSSPDDKDCVVKKTDLTDYFCGISPSNNDEDLGDISDYSREIIIEKNSANAVIDEVITIQSKPETEVSELAISLPDKTLVINFNGQKTDNEYDRLLAMLEFFSGEFPVKIIFNQTKEEIKLPNKYWITFNNDTILAITRRYGIDSIKLE
jgi:DNA polymerase-3 subunit alpha